MEKSIGKIENKLKKEVERKKKEEEELKKKKLKNQR